MRIPRIIAAFAGTLLFTAFLASAQSVVISQVYGGGGNSGATLKNDYIELLNTGGTTVNLAGWSVQYSSSTGTSWQATPLAGSLAPGQYYLIQEAQGSGGTQNLPTPDATGTIAMSSSSGKVALSSSAAALTGSCPTGLVDLVGFGSANCFEGGGATPGLGNTTAALRGNGGCTDTNNNAADFTAGTPNPHNTASPVNLCVAVQTPIISSLLPPSVVFGGPDFTLQVNGANFESGAVVNWNGTALSTSFGGAGLLTATVPAALTAAVGTASITVTNPDNQTSPPFAFNITGPPAPSITSTSPNAVPSYTPDFLLTVNGANFTAGSIIRWNNNGIPTNFASASQLTATIPAVLVTCPGNASVTVINPDQQVSPAATFTIQSPNATLGSCAAPLLIGGIQGSGSQSPLACGTTVSTTGIVTGKKSNGFFLQSPPPGDNDPNTSDGVFVFTSSAPSVTAGDSVCVTGTLSEFRYSSDAFGQSVTEIKSPTITPIASGQPLPPPVIIGPSDDNPNGGLDVLERFEGMRVQVNSLTVAAPTQGSVNERNATATSTGVFYGVVAGVNRPFTEPGIPVNSPLPVPAPCCVPRFDNNPERLRVDSDSLGGPALDVTAGATVSNVVGVLDYDYQAYMIDIDPSVTPSISGNVSATPAPAPAPGEYTVATYNMERFYDTVDDPATSDVVLTPTAFANRLNKASLVIRNVMQTPDVIGVEEVENITTLQAIADKVNGDAVAAGQTNPGYSAYLMEGNDIGGIDVGFLVKNTVQVTAVTQEGKNTTYINPNTGQPELLNDRPPLILDATFQGSPLTVIVNHLRSLGSIDDPVDGNRVRTKRRAQAEFLANLIQGRQAADSSRQIVVLGDFNAYQFNDGYVDSVGTVKGTPTPESEVILASPDLVNPDLIDAVDTFSADQKYSYSFDGNAQFLDHILLNAPARTAFTRIAAGRVDADFPEVYRNDPNRPERLSDHDPLVAYFRKPNQPPVATNQSAAISFGASGIVIPLQASDPENGPLTFATSVAPTKGTVTYDNGARTAAYTLNPGASGTDSFTYTVTDSSNQTASATVTITIVPADVTAQVVVTRSNLVFDSKTNTWVGRITVVNTGTQAIPGPVSVTLTNLSGGASVVSPTGTYNGAPYMTVTTTPLLPKSGKSVGVRFSAPNPKFTYTTTVYSGL